MTPKQIIEKLRDALKPFAELIEDVNDYPLDAGADGMTRLYVSIEDVAKAQEALDAIPPELQGINYRTYRVMLKNVDSTDVAEFADLLGTTGILTLSDTHNHYNPDKADLLSFTPIVTGIAIGKSITIDTDLGNKFYFDVLPDTL